MADLTDSERMTTEKGHREETMLSELSIERDALTRDPVADTFIDYVRRVTSQEQRKPDTPENAKSDRLPSTPRVVPHRNEPATIIFMEEVPNLLTKRQYDTIPTIIGNRPSGFHASSRLSTYPLSTADLFEEMVRKTFGNNETSRQLQRQLAVPSSDLERKLFAEFLSVFRDGHDLEGTTLREAIGHLHLIPPEQIRVVKTRASSSDSDQLRAARDRSRQYGKLLEDRPPVNTQPPLNIEIGIIEISTFFPNWIQIPQVNLRFQRNCATRKDLAKMQLHAANQLTADNLILVEQRIQKQNSRAGKTLHTPTRGWTRKIALRQGRQNDMTANTWSLEHAAPSRANFVPCKLKDIYGPVSRENWPTGQDRLYITQCLEYAADHEDLDLSTSDYQSIIQIINPQIPALENQEENRDEEAIDRFRRLVPDPVKGRD